MIDQHHDDEPEDDSSEGIIWTRYQQDHHAANVAGNDRFVLAMAKAVKRGRENVLPGTFVDLSEPIYHKRLYGETLRSCSGSPSAMCIESGGAAQGAQAMKRSPSYG